jgi:hypothetical protein
MRAIAAILFAMIAASSAALADDPPERVLGPQPPAIVFKATIGWTLTAVARIDVERGARVLVIEGDVINDSAQDRPAPKIRLGLRDGEGHEMYHWTVLPDEERIKAKDWASFSARLESPPEDMRQVEISTVESDG